MKGQLEQEVRGLASQSPITAQLDAYCLRLPSPAGPDLGTVFRIADQELQQRFAPAGECAAGRSPAVRPGTSQPGQRARGLFPLHPAMGSVVPSRKTSMRAASGTPSSSTRGRIRDRRAALDRGDRGARRGPRPQPLAGHRAHRRGSKLLDGAATRDRSGMSDHHHTNERSTCMVLRRAVGIALASIALIGVTFASWRPNRSRSEQRPGHGRAPGVGDDQWDQEPSSGPRMRPAR